MGNSFVIIRNGNIQQTVYSSASRERVVDGERRLVHPDGWILLSEGDEIRSVNMETVPGVWPRMGFQWAIDDNGNMIEDISQTEVWKAQEAELYKEEVVTKSKPNKVSRNQ